MSSAEEGLARPSSKKRRRANACDMCRKKKIKCDGRQLDTGKCTNCNTCNLDCTLMIESNKRYATGYIEALKTKIDKLEKLVERLAPDQDFTAEVGFKLTQANWMSPGVLGGPSKAVSKAALRTQSPNMSAFSTTPSAVELHATPSSATVSSHTIPSAGSEQVPPVASLPDEEQLSDDEETNIKSKLEQLSINSKVYTESNYFGRASWYGVISTTFSMCKKLRPDVDIDAFFAARANWQRPLWIDDDDKNLFRAGQRGGSGEHSIIEFPEPGLMNDLVDLYFANVNILVPTLHRPTFESNVTSSLHMKSRAFAGVVLLVCALGSRFSTNRDVLLEGDKTWHSAGWKWYRQASVFDTVHLDIPNSHLHHLQIICLAGVYAMGISAFYAGTFAAIGIKIALDIGAHKRAAYSVVPTVQDEMYKRAFWILVRLDRSVSATLGRPCNIQEEDFDLELPACCDDEYLVHTDGQEFARQPSNKPSLMTYFILSLRLSQIQGLAMRTIYASTKARRHYGFKGDEWIARTIAHLDSLLEQWNSQVPDYLRYDPLSTHEAFTTQALHLHMQYHELQIMHYRPFLSSSFPSPLPHVPLAICLKSARSLVCLTSALYSLRQHRACLYHLGASHWHASIILLIAIGNARLHEVAFDLKHAMADLDLMLGVLHESQDRWRWAPRFIFLIQMLKTMGEADDAELPPQLKRSYEEDVESSTHIERAPSYPSGSAAAPGIFGRANWNASAAFEEGGAGMPQSNGAMLGNVDFGALFGFGDLGLPDMSAYASSSSLGGVHAADLAPSDFGFGLEGWSQQGFDFVIPKTCELQWTTPRGAEYPETEYPPDGSTYHLGQWS